MTTKAERLAALEQAGFVHAQWDQDCFDELKQKQLLGVVRNDPDTTHLRSVCEGFKSKDGRCTVGMDCLGAHRC